ncbi:MAG: BON domain-containing protein [Vicinamibacterales bacterium]
MRTRVVAVLALSGLLAAGAPAPAAGQGPSPDEQLRIENIREALLRLPYYGVFDFLTFTYDKGAVVLGGYAYHGALAEDATRAVRRVRGVDDVKSEIVDLPASTFDDDIRWRVYYAIYTNAFLQKYHPGGGMLWGVDPALRRGAGGIQAVVPGAQPVGSYPIHIIVKGGRVRLLGRVDNATDKTAATMAARGVSGTFEVVNELVVNTP